MLVVMVSVTFQHLIESADKDQRLNIDWILDSCPDYKKKKGHLPVETSIFCGHGINNYILDRRFTFVTVKIPIQPDFFAALINNSLCTQWLYTSKENVNYSEV